MGCCKLEVYLGGSRVGEGEGEGEGSDAMFFLFPPPPPAPAFGLHSSAITQTFVGFPQSRYKTI